MISRSGAEALVAGRAMELPPGAGLRIACAKRDRCIEVVRSGPERFLVRQRGFDDADHETDAGTLRKLLKRLFKREFPRSNRLHLTAPAPSGAESSPRNA